MFCGSNNIDGNLLNINIFLKFQRQVLSALKPERAYPDNSDKTVVSNETIIPKNNHENVKWISFMNNALFKFGSCLKTTSEVKDIISKRYRNKNFSFFSVIVILLAKFGLVLSLNFYFFFFYYFLLFYLDFEYNGNKIKNIKSEENCSIKNKIIINKKEDMNIILLKISRTYFERGKVFHFFFFYFFCNMHIIFQIFFKVVNQFFFNNFISLSNINLISHSVCNVGKNIIPKLSNLAISFKTWSISFCNNNSEKDKNIRSMVLNPCPAFYLCRIFII
jgi:hypothetical protein